MSTFFNSVRKGFRGQPANNGGNQQRHNESPALSPTNFGPSSSVAPRVPPLPNSPSLASSLSLDRSYGSNEETNNLLQTPLSMPMQLAVPLPVPLFMRPECSGHSVKGNFMTLIAKPKTIELGEWLAHQVVEQYRNLCVQLQLISDISPHDNLPHCNPRSCHSMSAGSHTYTWLNNDRQPTKLPAIQYITLVQKWVTGKIQDPSIFPTDTRSISEEGAAKFVLGERSAGGGVLSQAVSGGASTHSSSSLSSQTWVGKSSGFPPEFEQVCKNITRQMFRVYAHLYWNHYRAPFYDLSIEKYLNSVFTLFVTMAREYDLLSPKDIEPMQGLIDLWIAQKVFPQDSKVVNFSHPVSTNTASLPSQASTVSPS